MHLAYETRRDTDGVARDRLADLARTIVGRDAKTPTLSGERRYVDLDNAATTPALSPVRDTVNRFLEDYSSVHRGAGWKSQVSTEVYEGARRIAAAFVGACPQRDVALFGRNTTDLINHLSHVVPLGSDPVVLVSAMEHHSNDLPWRRVASVVRVPVDHRGAIAPEDLERSFAAAGGRARLLAVSGASNVTGHIGRIHELAEIAHAHGALIMVDAAQLVAHRPVQIRGARPEADIDLIVYSGHKMYAPFGTGVLVGPRRLFDAAPPPQVGGGTVAVVTEDAVHWASTPDRDEAGTPNLIGALALARAATLLTQVGLDAIAHHEAELTARALARLASIRGVSVYGHASASIDRLGVITFNVQGLDHSLVAAALSWEAGVGVRHGCFCAHPFVAELLGVEWSARSAIAQRVISNDKSEAPGMVRMSFGLYNTIDDVNLACDQIERLATVGPRGEYRRDACGEWSPVGGHNAEVAAQHFLNGPDVHWTEGEI